MRLGEALCAQNNHTAQPFDISAEIQTGRLSWRTLKDGRTRRRAFLGPQEPLAVSSIPLASYLLLAILREVALQRRATQEALETQNLESGISQFCTSYLLYRFTLSSNQSPDSTPAQKGRKYREKLRGISASTVVESRSQTRFDDSVCLRHNLQHVLHHHSVACI